MASDVRRVVLAPHFDELDIELGPDALLICPGDLAASRYGRPPLSLDELARDICKSRIACEPHLNIASEHTTLCALAETLEESLHVSDPYGMARTMLPAVNLLYRDGIDLNDLEKRTRGPINIIARAALGTRERLTVQFRVSRADAISTALHRLNHLDALDVENRHTSIRQIVALGFARLGKVEARLLDRLAAPGSIVYLPYARDQKLFADNEAAARLLAGSGWSVESRTPEPITTGQLAAEAFLGIGQTPECVIAYSCPTVEDEVRTALGSIKRGLVEGKFTPDQVALVARSEADYGDIVREIGWEYGLPVHTHYSITLLETRFGQWLLSLLQLCEPALFPFESTARVAQHPLAAAIRPESWVTRWADARKEHTRGAEPWIEHELNLQPLIWPDQQARRMWCRQIRYQCEHTFHLRLHGLRRPQDLKANSVFLEELRAYEGQPNVPLTRSTFIQEMSDLMRLAAAPSDIGAAGIPLHTPLSLFGAKVDHLFILGAAEGQLPSPITDDPILDFHERKRLATAGLIELEDAAGAARRETLSFHSLLLAAKRSITFSFARLQGNSEASPSPFLVRMGVNVEKRDAVTGIAASKPELLHYQMREGLRGLDARLHYVWEAADVITGRERLEISSFTGDTGRSLDPASVHFTPNSILVFGQCSYRWFASKILKLADLEEADDDLAANLKGTLFHDTLNLAVAACKGEADLRIAITARLEEFFDAAADKIEGLTRLPGWRGRRYELLKQLSEAIDSDMFLLPESKVLSTEQSFVLEFYGLKVRGRLDRIDELKGNRVVIDYKTSSSKPPGAKDKTGSLELDVQLPIYMEWASRGHLSDQGKLDFADYDTTGYYFSLSNGEVLDGYGIDVRKLSQKKSDTEGLSALAATIKARVRTGSFPVDPDPKQDACKYCELDIVCRRGPHLVRAANRVKDTP